MPEGDGSTTAPAGNPDAGSTGSDNGSDAGKTLTQADVDRVVEQRLARERAKFADYDDLKSKAQEFAELEESKKSDLEKLTGERDTLKGRAETAEHKLTRFEVAADKKVPAEFAGRLQGATKEDLEKDADRLLELIGQSNTTSFDGGSRGAAAPAGDMDSLIRRAAGQG